MSEIAGEFGSVGHASLQLDQAYLGFGKDALTTAVPYSAAAERIKTEKLNYQIAQAFASTRKRPKGPKKGPRVKVIDIAPKNYRVRVNSLLPSEQFIDDTYHFLADLDSEDFLKIQAEKIKNLGGIGKQLGRYSDLAKRAAIDCIQDDANDAKIYLCLRSLLDRLGDEKSIKKDLMSLNKSEKAIYAKAKKILEKELFWYESRFLAPFDEAGAEKDILDRTATYFEWLDGAAKPNLYQEPALKLLKEMAILGGGITLKKLADFSKNPAASFSIPNLKKLLIGLFTISAAAVLSGCVEEKKTPTGEAVKISEDAVWEKLAQKPQVWKNYAALISAKTDTTSEINHELASLDGQLGAALEEVGAGPAGLATFPLSFEKSMATWVQSARSGWLNNVWAQLDSACGITGADKYVRLDDAPTTFPVPVGGVPLVADDPSESGYWTSANNLGAFWHFSTDLDKVSPDDLQESLSLIACYKSALSGKTDSASQYVSQILANAEKLVKAKQRLAQEAAGGPSGMVIATTPAATTPATQITRKIMIDGDKADWAGIKPIVKGMNVPIDELNTGGLGTCAFGGKTCKEAVNDAAEIKELKLATDGEDLYVMVEYYGSDQKLFIPSVGLTIQIGGKKVNGIYGIRIQAGSGGTELAHGYGDPTDNPDTFLATTCSDWASPCTSKEISSAEGAAAGTVLELKAEDVWDIVKNTGSELRIYGALVDGKSGYSEEFPMEYGGIAEWFKLTPGSIL